MPNRPWVPRVIGGAAEIAGVAYAVVGHPRWDAVFAGAALVLLGHGLVNVRSMSVERLTSAGRVAGVAAGVLLALGTATALLSPAPAEGRASLLEAARTALGRMYGHAAEWNAHEPIVRAVNDALPIATALVVIAMLVALVGPMRDVELPTDEDRQRVRMLCESADSDLLAPFTRRFDKRYVFSPDSRAVLGYRLAFGVCVAGAGPVGAPDAHWAAMAAWLQRCDERGWRPAMIGASQTARDLAATMGLRGIQIGDEAIVAVAPFRLDIPPMRNVRQAVQRTRNFGVVTSVHVEQALDGPTRAALDAVATEWRSGSGELGFAMTLDHLLDGSHPDAVLFVAWHEGRAVGFQRYVVCRGGTGLSLDVMPRIRVAPNGVNERLIVEAILWARDRGVDDVSLNFAAFRTLFESAPTIGHRLVRRVVHLLDPFINVESLYRFNAKFQPEWCSRHVLFRSLADIPLFIVAALRLEFGRRPVTSAVESEHAASRPDGLHA